MLNNEKTVILIGHKKRHGKDTLAAMLHDALGDCDVFAFADPMKEILAESKGITVAELDELKNNDPLVREEIIRFGNGLMKHYFGMDVWLNIAKSKIDKSEAKYIIVSDLRWPNEVYDGDVITVNVHNDRVLNNSDCESETSMDGYKYDYIIYNNQTLGNLRLDAIALADTIMQAQSGD